MRWLWLCVGIWGCGPGEIVTIEPDTNQRQSPPGLIPVIKGQTNDDRKTGSNALPLPSGSDGLPGAGTLCQGGERQVAILPLREGNPTQCLFNVGSFSTRPGALRVTFRGAEVPQDATHTHGWDQLAPLSVIGLYGAWCNDDLRSHPEEVLLLEACQDRLGPVK